MLLIAAVISTNLLLALVLAEPPAPPGPPPTADEIARCKARMPAPSRAKEGFREVYVERWVKDLCEGETARNRPFQACVLNAMSSRKLRPDQTHDAYNGCIPGVPECRARMGAQAQTLPGAASAKRFVNKFCQSMASSLTTPEERACVLRYAAKGDSFHNPSLLGTLCSAETRGCVDALLDRGKFARTLRTYEELAAACGGGAASDPAWTSCVLEGLQAPDGGRQIPRGQGGLQNVICASGLRDRKSCIRDTLSEIRRRRLHIDLSDAELIRQLDDLCRSGAVASSRDCLLDMLSDNVSIGTARTACRFGSASMRSCLVDFIRSLPPFDDPVFEQAREHTSQVFDERLPDLLVRFSPAALRSYENTLGYRICGLSAGAGRSCIIRSIKPALRDGRWGKQEFKQAQEACISEMPAARACTDFFSREYRLIERINDSVPFDQVIRIHDVCSIPADEVRECVIRGLPRMLNSRQSFRDLIAACHASFLGYMLDGVVSSSEPCH